MQKASPRIASGLLALLGCVISLPIAALEIITKEDLQNNIVTEEQLVRLADNAIFLVDTSSSMNEEFRDTGVSKYDSVINAFKDRNAYFPEIGHRFGVYDYTPWNEVYGLKLYDREKMAAALKTLPERGAGATPLAVGLVKAEEIIKPLDGRTALFLFFDGQYSGRNPNPDLWRLTRENDVCLIIVSSASEEEDEALERNVAKLNSCSRVVRLEDYLARPEYMSNALFDVIATEKVITTSQQKVGGVRVDNLLFGFDKTDLSAGDRAELDELGEFMSANPQTFAVLAGYTDNVGIEDYNENLSRQRTEQVAEYLMTEHGIDTSRLVLHWHGSDNPVASNSTDEGRSLNRRVEVVVGGL